MAANNDRLCPKIETVFLTASETNQFISSRFVKEIARLGGDVSSFVSRTCAPAGGAARACSGTDPGQTSRHAHRAVRFDLPPELIAQHPARPRDAARLLVVGAAGPRTAGCASCRTCSSPGDLLVLNDTRVIPARLVGRAARRGRGDAAPARADGSPLAGVRAARQAAAGRRAADVRARLRGRGRGQGRGRRGRRSASTCAGGTLLARLEAARRDAAAALHQAAAAAAIRATGTTIRPCSRAAPGAVAAPTAALHFTPALMAALAARGIGARVRDPARRRRHLPAGQGRRHRGSPDARRAVRARAGDGRGDRARARRRRARGRGRHHGAARAGEPPRRPGALRAGRRRDPPVHHARLPLPGGRPAADQLPSAALDPVHAGRGLRRAGADAAAYAHAIAHALPLLLLRRRLPAGAGATRR